MPNAYFTVFFLLLEGAIVYGADHFGYVRGSNAAKIECGAVRDASLKAFSEQLKIASGHTADLERIGRDQAQRGSDLAKTLNSSIEGLRNAKLIPADCIDPVGRLRIIEAVRSINGYGHPATDSALKLPGKLPAATGASQ